MRPVQQLYYQNGQLCCPAHGNRYVRFMSSDCTGCKTDRRIDCSCEAVLPDGTRCPHCAAWDSIFDIHDADVEQLAVAYQQQDFHP